MPALSRRIHDLPSRARLLHFPLSTTFFPSHRTNRRCSPDIRVSKLISLRKLERILKDKLVLPTFTPNPQAQQQQQTEKQAETQSPAPGTPFRRLGPLARGTQLSQLGGSSPMNLFSFVDQLANAMTDDLAGESSLYHTNLSSNNPPSIQSNLSIRSNPSPSPSPSPSPALRVTKRRLPSLYPPAAMMPFGHKDSVGTFPNHLAFPYDIVDKRSEYVITADIPGASKDMVEVSVDDDRVLHIVDERADRHEERGGSEADGGFILFPYGQLV